MRRLPGGCSWSSEATWMLTNADFDRMCQVVHRETVCSRQHKVLRHHSPHAGLMSLLRALGTKQLREKVQLPQASMSCEHSAPLSPCLKSPQGRCCAYSDGDLGMPWLLVVVSALPVLPNHATEPQGLGFIWQKRISCYFISKCRGPFEGGTIRDLAIIFRPNSC